MGRRTDDPKSITVQSVRVCLDADIQILSGAAKTLSGRLCRIGFQQDFHIPFGFRSHLRCRGRRIADPGPLHSLIEPFALTAVPCCTVVPGDLRLFPVPLFKITGIRRTLRIKIPYTFFVSGMAVKRKVMKICPDPVCFHIFRRNSFFIKALHCFPVFAAIRSGSYLCKNIISHIISGEGINFLRLIRLGDCRHDFVLSPNVSASIPDNIRAVILRFRKIIRQPQHFAFKTDHRIARKPWCRHFPGMNSDIRTGLQSLFGLRREYYFRLMVYITVFQLQQTAPLRHTLYFYGVCTVSFYFKMYLTLPLTPIKGQAFSLYIYGRSACFQFKSL